VAAPPRRRDDALNQLPLPYSTALRLRDSGVANELIAEQVGVDLGAIYAFMQLAEAKLESLLR
jgi:DNA-directed RNA polymerase specialized sigma24 family protein